MAVALTGRSPNSFLRYSRLTPDAHLDWQYSKKGWYSKLEARPARASFPGLACLLVQTAQATVRQAEQVLTVLQEKEAKAAEKLVQSLQIFLPRLEQVLQQTVRRVLQDESVPAEEKLVSIFEPHSDIIRRGKPRKSAEFGHKVWLGEWKAVSSPSTGS